MWLTTQMYMLYIAAKIIHVHFELILQFLLATTPVNIHSITSCTVDWLHGGTTTWASIAGSQIQWKFFVCYICLPRLAAWNISKK